MTGTVKAILTLSAAVFAAPVLAQSADIDINGDGMYSYAEVRAYAPDLSQETFNVVDTSGDGLLDASEIAAGVSAGLLPA
ncbi:hypothetical protein [Yoonia sp.]|uniref:hypothetical protein n=1 Tax=Yoonia sp. TaxID=2212373 RepID=UPI0023B71B5B